MSAFQALIMGILQGLTEFLPVSSSAHLKLSKLLLGVAEGDNLVVFDLVCHLGTLVALLLFLRTDIVTLFRTDRKRLWMILVATIPLFPFYFLLKPLRDWASQASFLGIFLIVTSFILFIGSRIRISRPEAPTLKHQMRDSLWIGIMQAAALIPGISRSASTISCAHVLGWSARDAVRFSFLLSVPTILGGNSVELLKIFLSPSSQSTNLGVSSCLIGFFGACSVGFIVIRFAVRILEKGDLRPFAWYCLALGLITTLCLTI
ncbi:MAG: undecaprenyl-diphosphate phosphatase [Chlamydiales bacterium]|nr:undecaprenyl-diphosphate phosphatase [Chlamydiales bacterium]